MQTTSPDELQRHPHCSQCSSEHRHSYTDIEFTHELDLRSVPSAPYVDLKQEPHSVTHWGQMKLLLGEIEFLTQHLGVPDLTVVYAGCSPGHHLKALVDLMPDTWEWKLFDARPCEVYSNEPNDVLEKVCSSRTEGSVPQLKTRIEIQKETLEHLRGVSYAAKIKQAENHLQALCSTILIERTYNPRVSVNQYNLTPQAAETLQGSKVVLISDLRTPLVRISEHIVHADMEAQLRIVQALNPMQATLKFKLPYSECFRREVCYLKGSLRYQPFSPRISHETRLVTGGGLYQLAQYNIDEYANHMYHYQTVLRTSVYNLDEPVADPERHSYLVDAKVGTDHCYDCVAARLIVRQFITKKQGTEATHEQALDLLNELTKQLTEMQLSCRSEGPGILDE